MGKKEKTSEKEEVCNLAVIRPYSKNNYSKFSPELFNKNYRTKLSLYAQKLLFGLAASIKEDLELFPEWEIPISGLFKYLNLSEDNNARYYVVRDTIKEIASSVLEFEVSAKEWRYLPWFADASFASDKSEYVHIEFSPKVKPFLLQLKEYCLLEARYYIDLSSEYALWLYPLLRNAANKRYSYLELTLEEIKKLTFNEKTDTYNPKKNPSANKDLLKWVLGIVKDSKSGEYVFLKKKDKNGEYYEAGALWEINNKTDLKVSCKVLKTGRAITSVMFNISFKRGAFAGKKKTTEKINSTQETICQIEEIKMNNLFPTSVTKSSVYELAKALNLTIEDTLKKTGYKLEGNFAIKIDK